MTVAELLTLYAADTFPSKDPSTCYQHEVVYRAVGRAFGALPVCDLTPALLRQWRDDLRQRYAPGTIRRWLETLSSALTAAVREYEILEVNPLARVRKPPAPRGRERFLTAQEQAALSAACQRSRNKALYPLVRLALTTGARKNELRCLRWRDVDLEQGLLRFVRTKNGEGRAVPLSQDALILLRAWRITQTPESVWVFPRADGHRPIDISKAWYIARHKAGLDDFRFHDLRHTAASYLAMSGASLVEIAHILGHKTMRMVQRYSHFTDVHTRGTVEKMAQQFLTPPEPEV